MKRIQFDDGTPKREIKPGDSVIIKYDGTRGSVADLRDGNAQLITVDTAASLKAKSQIEALWKDAKEIRSKIEEELKTANEDAKAADKQRREEWAEKFGRPFPDTVDALKKLAAECGISTQALFEENYGWDDMLPIIEGFLDRAKNQSNNICSELPTPENVQASWRHAKQSFDRAVNAPDGPDPKPLNKVYAWLEVHPDDYDLPDFQTWSKYLRAYRAATTGPKSTPRAGRQGRSITRPDQQ